MKARLRFPIRLKLLVALLFVVTAIVSVITFTMASMFHEDKKTYIIDVVSVGATSSAQECRAHLVSFSERLTVYARIMSSPVLDHDEKSRLLESLFSDFPELVAVRLSGGDRIVAEAFDEAALEEAALTRAELEEVWGDSPIPAGALQGGEAYVVNATLSESLPMFTLALAHDESDGPPLVVTSLIRLDALLDLAARPRVYEVMFVGSDGVVLAHPDIAEVVSRRQPELSWAEGKLVDARQAGYTTEFEEDGVERIGGLAAVEGGVVAVAQINKSKAYLASRELLRSLVYVALGLLLVATVVSLVGAYRFTRPVERLSAATKQIARGEFDIRVDVDSADEIGALAGSFNQMASELKYRAEALEAAQRQLIQSEKMAAFGQLGAGIAHEVKNPLAGILGCAQLSLRKAEEGTSLRRNLELIEKETKRCKQIIENLMKFARQEKAELRSIGVNAVVEETVALVAHQAGIHQVDVVSVLDESAPTIEGNANQLKQVLMNLVLNAQQAMSGNPGRIEIETRRDGDRIVIAVRDDGPGIPDHVQAKLFEPFFTTKPAGEGTGLGLSVSYGIIKDHMGEITVESEVGEGATFLISLPEAAATRSTGEVPPEPSVRPAPDEELAGAPH